MGLGETGRGSRDPSFAKPKPPRAATRTAVERSGRPTSRQARPGVFDSDTRSNSCRTVRRLRGATTGRFHGSQRIERCDQFTFLVDSITCSLKLRVVNLFSSWQHACILPMPEAKDDQNFRSTTEDWGEFLA